MNWIATPWHQLAITKQSKRIQETEIHHSNFDVRHGKVRLWLGFNLGPCWPASAWTAATDMLAPVSVSHALLYLDFMFIFVFVFAACGLLTCNSMFLPHKRMRVPRHLRERQCQNHSIPPWFVLGYGTKDGIAMMCRISGLFRHSEIAHPKIRIARGPTEKRIPFLALSSASILGTCASYLQG